MTYASSVLFLYSLGNELKVGGKWDLNRMRVLLAALGNPESGRRFVHVAGTNGKGSTSAMLASILTSAGLRTGLYTSPHLVRINERIRIGDAEIGDADFAGAFTRIHAAIEELLASGALLA